MTFTNKQNNKDKEKLTRNGKKLVSQLLSVDQTPGEIARDYLMIAVGTLMTTAGIYFFKFPNNFSTGGISGLSVILTHYFPNISASDYSFIVNMLLLFVGFISFGKSFGIRTVFASVLSSVSLSLLARVLPMDAPMTSQPLLELIFAVSLPAVGSAILFNLDASTGGTDVIAMILRKYSSLDIGKALLCSDLLITVAACVAFGMETGLFCVLGLAMKSVMVDMVLENIKINKCFHIITVHPEPILKFITEDLHRGATRMEGEGVFTHEDRTVILTVMNRRQAILLRNFVKVTDPHAFLLINNTSEIIGKGFRGAN